MCDIAIILSNINYFSSNPSILHPIYFSTVYFIKWMKWNTRYDAELA